MSENVELYPGGRVIGGPIRDYLTLQMVNAASAWRLCGVLNRREAASLTVCPFCRVDDFTHRAGCELSPDGEIGREFARRRA